MQQKLYHTKIENAILASHRTGDCDNLSLIQTILQHKRRVLDHRIEKLMVGEEFELNPTFRAVSEQYAQIVRLTRIVDSYAR